MCSSATTKAKHVILDLLYIQSKGMLEKSCLLENNIIVETTGYSRNQIFTFQKYTDLFLK